VAKTEELIVSGYVDRGNDLKFTQESG